MRQEAVVYIGGDAGRVDGVHICLDKAAGFSCPNCARNFPNVAEMMNHLYAARAANVQERYTHPGGQRYYVPAYQLALDRNGGYAPITYQINWPVVQNYVGQNQNPNWGQF